MVGRSFSAVNEALPYAGGGDKRRQGRRPVKWASRPCQWPATREAWRYPPSPLTDPCPRCCETASKTLQQGTGFNSGKDTSETALPQNMKVWKNKYFRVVSLGFRSVKACGAQKSLFTLPPKVNTFYPKRRFLRLTVQYVRRMWLYIRAVRGSWSLNVYTLHNLEGLNQDTQRKDVWIQHIVIYELSSPTAKHFTL